MKIRSPQKILVFRNDRFGEFLLNIPAFRAIKESFPNSKLSVVVNSHLKELAGSIKYINEVIEWNGQKHSLADKIKLIKYLKKNSYDIAIMMNPSKEFNIIAYLAGIPIRAGYDKKWGFLLNYKIKDNKFLGQEHEIDYNLELVNLIGAKTEDKSLSLVIENTILPEEIIPQNNEDFLVIHPWTSDPIKQWPIENFIALAKRIASELKIRTLIVGGNLEVKKSAGYWTNLGAGLITDITGKTSLLELAYILKKSKLLISGDSGPVHLACAAHTPVIAIFRNDIQGKTAKRWGPWGQNNVVIEKSNLYDITVNEVFSKITGVLK
ncbi:MAG: glycosyltransferase family 9 protein [Candidatus Omnitrophota bacterium]